MIILGYTPNGDCLLQMSQDEQIMAERLLVIVHTALRSQPGPEDDSYEDKRGALRKEQLIQQVELLASCRPGSLLINVLEEAYRLYPDLSRVEVVAAIESGSPDRYLLASTRRGRLLLERSEGGDDNELHR